MGSGKWEAMDERPVSVPTSPSRRSEGLKTSRGQSWTGTRAALRVDPATERSTREADARTHRDARGGPQAQRMRGSGRASVVKSTSGSVDKSTVL